MNFLGLLSLGLLLSSFCLANPEKKGSDGFISLFDGKDLSHWQTTGNWLPQKDGSLLIQPKLGQEGWQRYSDYLISKEKFGDFILTLEYKYPPKGNSGVFFRIGDPKNPVKTGIECQILDSSGKADNQMGHHDHGGIIRTVGPRFNMSKEPGEWNQMKIQCQGHQLIIHLNGEQIINHWVDSAGKGKLTGVSDRPIIGYIGLQDHGVPNNLYFRNLRIKKL